MRRALDREGFRHVRIVVSGGFTAEKIRQFEERGDVDPKILTQAYIWAGYANRVLGEFVRDGRLVIPLGGYVLAATPA